MVAWQGWLLVALMALGTFAIRLSVLGAMSEREWQRFEYLHFDHHLRQFGV